MAARGFVSVCDGLSKLHPCGPFEGRLLAARVLVMVQGCLFIPPFGPLKGRLLAARVLGSVHGGLSKLNPRGPFEGRLVAARVLVLVQGRLFVTLLELSMCMPTCLLGFFKLRELHWDYHGLSWGFIMGPWWDYRDRSRWIK